jgi:hypothetical protein
LLLFENLQRIAVQAAGKSRISGQLAETIPPGLKPMLIL